MICTPLFDHINTIKYNLDVYKENILDLDKMEKNEIWAAITIECVDLNNAEYIVHKEFEKALDVISCYVPSDIPVTLDSGSVVILDEQGNLVSSKMGTDKNSPIFHDIQGRKIHIDLVARLQNIFSNYSDVVLDNEMNVGSIIAESGYWFRKGEETNKLEDKFIDYWISLENLISSNLNIPKCFFLKSIEENSKIGKITSIVPKLLIQKHILDKVWLYYDCIANYYYHHLSTAGISDELAESSSLKYDGEEIYINNFLNSLDALQKNISSRFYKDLICELKSFINDDKCSMIDEIIKEITDYLLIGYRYRNMIVHNAKSDMYFLDYYAKKISKR